MESAQDKARPATPARIYDYLLGGFHNFPADQEAGRRVVDLFPDTRYVVRANRAFLGRAVRYLAEAGVRQFLDIGSGIPTQGNVHEIVQQVEPETRIVYVDIDPVAVGEALDLLAANPYATAIHGDLRNPGEILDHPALRKLLNLNQPTALLLAAVLHFIPDDDQPYVRVAELVDALAPGSYLTVSHTATEAAPQQSYQASSNLYKRQADTSLVSRTKDEVAAFVTGLDLVDPGIVWLPQWRPDPNEPDLLADQPQRSLCWAVVGRKPTTAA